MTQQPLARTAPDRTGDSQPDLTLLPDVSASAPEPLDGIGVVPPVDAFDLEVATPDLVRLYLDEIGKAPLLDAATEVDLARRIEAGLYARHLLDDLGQRRAVKLREARKVATTRSSWTGSRPTASSRSAPSSGPTCGWWSRWPAATAGRRCRCST